MLSYRRKVALARCLLLAGACGALGLFLQWVRSPVLVPLPEIAGVALGLTARAAFLRAFLATGALILGTFLLAAASGSLVGIALWRWRPLREIFTPLLQAYYAAPSFALYPVFVALFGLGPAPIVIAGWLFAFPAIAINVATGLLEVPSVYGKVGRSLVLSPACLFFRVHVPASLPQWFTGLKLGFCYAMISVLAAEFILSVSGVGRWLSDAFSGFRYADLYGGMLLVLILAAAVVLLLNRAEARYYRKWSV